METLFREKDFYKEKIIEMIQGINNVGTLEYLETFIRLFLKKWGQ